MSYRKGKLLRVPKIHARHVKENGSVKERESGSGNVLNVKESANVNGSVTVSAKGRGRETARENANVIVNVSGIGRENENIVIVKNTKEKKKKLSAIPVLRLDLPYLNDSSVSQVFICIIAIIL